VGRVDNILKIHRLNPASLRAHFELIEYALKLTLKPWNMIRADVQRLREAGFTDAGAFLT
jgi:uncharacterized protein YciW